MPRIVPSLIVRFIDSIPKPEGPKGLLTMNTVDEAVLWATLDLLDQVPDELLTMDVKAFGEFVHSRWKLKEIVTIWNANRTAGTRLQVYVFKLSRDPLTVIRNALVQCPDESPSPSTSELALISDPELKANLRNDLGIVNRALSNGEWKAATVIAGSIIEALLLWKLQQVSAQEIARVSQIAPKLPNKPLDEWHLPDYINAAERLTVISSDAVTQVKLAKDFRNLIHPGRAKRLGQKCDRGTALSAVAGVEHVVRDLTP